MPAGVEDRRYPAAWRDPLASHVKVVEARQPPLYQRPDRLRRYEPAHPCPLIVQGITPEIVGRGHVGDLHLGRDSGMVRFESLQDLGGTAIIWRTTTDIAYS